MSFRWHFQFSYGSVFVSTTAVWHKTFVQVHQNLGDQPSPASLMTSPAAAAGVAIEILMERNQIAPMRTRVNSEQAPDTVRLPCGRAGKCLPDTGQVLQRPGPSSSSCPSPWGTPPERITVVQVLLQRQQNEKINGPPDGAAPVGVVAEYLGPGLPRLIVQSTLLTT